MTVGLLVIAHDKIGSSIIDTALALIGTKPLQIESLELFNDSDLDSCVQSAYQLAEKLDQGDGVLVLTDLYGSTPYNVTKKLDVKNNLKIISGLNLPMLIRAFNYPALSLSEMTEKVLDGGKNGILACN